MTLQRYKEESAALGINRGAFTDGKRFEPELLATTGTQKFRDKATDYTKPGKITAKTLGLPVPDLSYLNPKSKR